MTTWTVTVTITQNGLGVFTADVSPASVGVVDGDAIDWDITEPVEFPQDAEVFLQFFKLNGAGKKIVDKGCLQGGNNGKHKGTGNGNKKKLINGTVKAATHSGKKTYLYLMAYTATTGSGTLVDPEIVVDGGVKKKAAQSSRRPVAAKKAKKAGKARKAAVVKKGKQQNPAKTAKRSTKRKAKKR